MATDAIVVDISIQGYCFMAVALLIISCMRSVPSPSRARASAFYIIYMP